MCIATMEGKIVAAEYRQGAVPFRNRQDAELSVMQALIRMNMRKTMEHELGRPLYSLTEYEKLTRASILIQKLSDGFGLGDEFVVVLSIEKHASNPLALLKEKILPIVQMTLG